MRTFRQLLYLLYLYSITRHKELFETDYTVFVITLNYKVIYMHVISRILHCPWVFSLISEAVMNSKRLAETEILQNNYLKIS